MERRTTNGISTLNPVDVEIILSLAQRGQQHQRHHKRTRRFSYEIKVRPGEENEIIVTAGGYDDMVDMRVTVGDKVYDFSGNGDFSEYLIKYAAAAEQNAVRIRIDRISPNAPLIRSIKVR